MQNHSSRCLMFYTLGRAVNTLGIGIRSLDETHIFSRRFSSFNPLEFFWILNSWFLSGLNMQMKMRNVGNKLKEHHWLDPRERLSNHWLLKKRKIAGKIIPRVLQTICKGRTSPIQLFVFKMQIVQFTNSCQSGNRSNVLEMWNTITTIISYKLA